MAVIEDSLSFPVLRVVATRSLRARLASQALKVRTVRARKVEKSFSFANERVLRVMTERLTPSKRIRMFKSLKISRAIFSRKAVMIE